MAHCMGRLSDQLKAAGFSLIYARKGTNLSQRIITRNAKSNWPWWIRTTINGSKVSLRADQLSRLSSLINSLAAVSLHVPQVNTG